MAPVVFSPNGGLTLVGKGSLWLDEFDANDVSSGHYMALGNCDKFGITVKDTIKKNYNSMDHTAAVYRTTPVQRDMTLKIQGFEFGADQAKLNFMANDPTALAQSSGSIVAEALAAAGVTKKGRAFFTLNREISAVVVVCGAATLVAGTDYVVKDAHLGLIYFPEDSTVVDATAVTVSYTAAVINAASNMQQIFGGTRAAIRGRLVFSGDPMTGPNWDVIVPRVMLTPNQEQDFISADYLKWTLEGTIEDNSAYSPTIQYFQATRRA